MNPKALAGLHARCFVTPRPWRADEFAALLASSGSFLITADSGFALGRIAGPEAELLTIAVDPAQQGQGIGGQLLQSFLKKAAALNAQEAFLEVAENNITAIALYRRAGFKDVAKRAAYFKQANGPALTALVMKTAI